MAKESDKRPLIVWSGGYDSTVLIMDCVMQHRPFDLLTIDIANNKLKVEAESKAQNKILSIINPSHLLCDHYRWEFGICKGWGMGLGQPLVWLSGILYHLNKSHSEVHMGYIKGDCIMEWSEQMQRTYKEMFNMGVFDFKMPELKWPLKDMDKEAVIRNWYKNDDFGLGQRVFPHIWTCEQPQKVGRGFKPCDKCTPCQNKLKALHIIEYWET